VAEIVPPQPGRSPSGRCAAGRGGP
jgi:hypothetical protein